MIPEQPPSPPQGLATRESPKRHRDVPEGCPLTTHQWKIVKLVAEGLTYKQIALAEGLAVSTVRTHIHAAHTKLKVAGAKQMIVAVMSSGWLEKIDVDWEDARVTPAQRLYLDAFDKFLSAKTAKVAMQARGQMLHHLVSMLIEQDVPTPLGRLRGEESGPSIDKLLACDKDLADAKDEYEEGKIDRSGLEKAVERALNKNTYNK